jgi:hypothetical protein
MGMNYTDEINYFHWKNLVLKSISKEWITKPYSWMMGGEKKLEKKVVEKEEVEKEEEDIEKGLELVEMALGEEKENLEVKVGKFSLESKVNSMRFKLKAGNQQ